MTTYYNEIDPYAAQWLRNLVAAGHIAPGDVDERSIVDVRADDLRGYTQCHFFAGIGGWSLALRLAGWPDDRPVWTGSCPCQPFSAAGSRAGFDDPRHLWPTWFRLIRQRRPSIVFGEQVASPHGLLWSDLVHHDLEGARYAFAAFDLCAGGLEAPQLRQRLFWVASPEDAHWWGEQQAQGAWRRRDGFAGSGATRPLASAYSPELQHEPPAGQQPIREPSGGFAFWRDAAWVDCRDGLTRPFEPGSFPLAYGLPAGVEKRCAESDRLAVRAARTYRIGAVSGYGNAIVPQLAAEFIRAVA